MPASDIDHETSPLTSRLESACEPAGASVHDKIMFDGRYYRYKSYRYDFLADACNYARLDATRPTSLTAPEGHRKWTEAAKPTAVEAQTMADLNITFDGKYYRYDQYRYDRFADAVNYAQLQRRIRC